MYLFFSFLLLFTYQIQFTWKLHTAVVFGSQKNKNKKVIQSTVHNTPSSTTTRIIEIYNTRVLFVSVCVCVCVCVVLRLPLMVMEKYTSLVLIVSHIVVYTMATPCTDIHIFIYIDVYVCVCKYVAVTVHRLFCPATVIKSVVVETRRGSTHNVLNPLLDTDWTGKWFVHVDEGTTEKAAPASLSLAGNMGKRTLYVTDSNMYDVLKIDRRYSLVFSIVRASYS